MARHRTWVLAVGLLSLSLSVSLASSKEEITFDASPSQFLGPSIAANPSPVSVPTLSAGADVTGGATEVLGRQSSLFEGQSFDLAPAVYLSPSEPQDFGSEAPDASAVDASVSKPATNDGAWRRFLGFRKDGSHALRQLAEWLKILRPPDPVDARGILEGDRSAEEALGQFKQRSELADSPEALERLVPVLACHGCRHHTAESKEAREALRSAITLFGPIRVISFLDPNSPHDLMFSAIDLGAEPKHVDSIPNLDKREKIQILKILRRASNVLALEPAEGKTPDLIVDGVVTEMKEVLSEKDVVRVVGHGNAQVADFSKRTGIPGGELTLHWLNEEPISAARIGELLNEWASSSKEDIALRRVWVYVNNEVTVFSFQKNRRYAVEKSFIDPGLGEPLKPASNGRLSAEDEKILRQTAKDKRDALNAVREVRKLAALGRFDELLRFWENFCQIHGVSAKYVERDVSKVLEQARIKDAQARSLLRKINNLERMGRVAEARRLWDSLRPVHRRSLKYIDHHVSRILETNRPAKRSIKERRLIRGFLREITRLVKRGEWGRATHMWENFLRSHPVSAREIEPKVSMLIPLPSR